MDQLDVFSLLYDRFMFPKEHMIRLVELFSGIGFQSMGMSLANINHEQVATSEIDKYAIKSYEAIHGISNNLGDISKLIGADFPKEIDIMTYSFPCQDLSKAGKQKGMGEGSRSGLIYEVLRILNELQKFDNLPKVLIMENVTDIVGDKFIKEFNEIQLEIESHGYMNYTKNLNAKDYGIAQNRDRTFMVSILGHYSYEFPQAFDLEHRLKDYLEDDVDEKYYLSEKALNGMRNTTFNSASEQARVTDIGGIVPTLLARDYKDPKCVRVGGIFDKDDKRRQAGAIWDKEHLAPTLDTMQGGWRQPSIVVTEATVQGYAEAYNGDSINLSFPNSKTRRGRVGKQVSQTLLTNNQIGVVVEDFYKNREPRYYEDVSPTIRAERQGLKVVATAQRGRENVQQLEVSDREYANALTTVQKDSMIGIKEKKLRIRKLTPVETGRLMGMNDEQINKQLEAVSNSQAYKQHGNGIVAQVIGLIIGMMVYEDENELRETVMKNSHKWLKEQI